MMTVVIKLFAVEWVNFEKKRELVYYLSRILKKLAG